MGRDDRQKTMKKKRGERARGDGFFSAEDTLPYIPKGELVAQLNYDSCTSACCRMLLKDEDKDAPESHISIILKLDKGAYVRDMPGALSEFGLSKSYRYHDDLSVDDLRQHLTKAPAVVSLKRPQTVGRHALIVDGIEDNYVLIRDPLPRASGAAYKVSLDDFLTVWLKKLGTGIALVVE